MNIDGCLSPIGNDIINMKNNLNRTLLFNYTNHSVHEDIDKYINIYMYIHIYIWGGPINCVDGRQKLENS